MSKPLFNKDNFNTYDTLPDDIEHFEAWDCGILVKFAVDKKGIIYIISIEEEPE